MKILIDADGCPVVDITVSLATKHNAECIILCDTSHFFEKEGATTITVSKGADSVDFALVNMTHENDIVITQDYGLAAMCLSKKAIVLNQNGIIYTDSNIDSMLEQRHTAKQIRSSKTHQKPRFGNFKKRTPEQDISFKNTLLQLMENK